jgi:hypothetical protein
MIGYRTGLGSVVTGGPDSSVMVWVGYELSVMVPSPWTVYGTGGVYSLGSMLAIGRPLCAPSTNATASPPRRNSSSARGPILARISCGVASGDFQSRSKHHCCELTKSTPACVIRCKISRAARSSGASVGASTVGRSISGIRLGADSFDEFNGCDPVDGGGSGSGDGNEHPAVCGVRCHPDIPRCRPCAFDVGGWR